MIYSLDELTALLSSRASDNGRLIGAKVAYPTGDEGEFEICTVVRMSHTDVAIEMPICCGVCGGECVTLYLWHCIHGWQHLFTKEGMYVCEMGEYHCLKHRTSPLSIILVMVPQDVGDERLHRPPAGHGIEMLN